MAHQQRDLKRERTWRRHVAAQRTSGLTIRDFCHAQDLRETSFHFWRKEIAKRDREAAEEPKAASAFVPVAVIDTPAIADAPIDIRLAEGHRVRVRAGCDRRLLADVMALLRGSASEGRPC